MVGAGTTFGLPMAAGYAGASVLGGKPQLVKLAKHGFGRAALSVTGRDSFVPKLQASPADFLPSLPTSPTDFLPDLGSDGFHLESPFGTGDFLQAQDMPDPWQLKKDFFSNPWVKKYVRTVKPYTDFLGVYNTKETIVGGSAILGLVSALFLGWGIHRFFCKAPEVKDAPTLGRNFMNINPSADREIIDNLDTPNDGIDENNYLGLPKGEGEGSNPNPNHVVPTHQGGGHKPLGEQTTAIDPGKAPGPQPTPIVWGPKPKPLYSGRDNEQVLEQEPFRPSTVPTAPPASVRQQAPGMVSLRGEDVQAYESEAVAPDVLRELGGPSTSELLEDSVHAESSDDIPLDHTLAGQDGPHSSETYVMDDTMVIPGEHDIPDVRDPEPVGAYQATPAQQMPPAPPSSPAVATPKTPERVERVQAPSAVNSSFPNVPGYVIEKELGEGGMGTVYLAHNERVTSLKVAIKVIRVDKRHAARMAVDFQREADAMARVEDRQHVVQLYDINRTEDGLVYMVMEYCKNGNMHEWVKENKPVPEGTVIYMGKLVAKGLQAIFEAGLLHRDIKPANILLATGDIPKITDLGLAKAADKSQTTKALRGTPAFMAPEQITKAVKTDIRADIYAAGMIIYYMATGKIAFKAKDRKASAEAQLLQILNAKQFNVYPDPRQYRSNLSPALVDVINKCMEADPNDRYQTPEELFAALEALED